MRFVAGSEVVRFCAQVESRTGEDAYIPLRPLTTHEAAFLINSTRGSDFPHTALVRIDGQDVLLATRLFVVPSTPANSGPGEWIDDSEKVGQFRLASASWEDYCSLYRVQRSKLEKTLGRSLAANEFLPSFTDTCPVSFSPDHIPQYVAAEITFLTLWLTVTGFVVSRLRRLTAILPSLVPLLLVPFIFVGVYSPAFIDADWFHQRIVVESISVACLNAGTILILPAALSLVAYGTLRLADWLAHWRNMPTARYRAYAQGTLIATALIYLLIQYGLYRVESTACQQDLDRATARIQLGAWVRPLLDQSAMLPRQVNLMEGAEVVPGIQETVKALLVPAGENADRELVVLVPRTGPEGEHLFLWRNGFLYADFRKLGADFRNQIDAEELVKIQRLGSHSTGFARVFSGGHLCGRSLKVDEHEVIVAMKEPSPSGRLGVLRW